MLLYDNQRSGLCESPDLFALCFVTAESAVGYPTA